MSDYFRSLKIMKFDKKFPSAALAVVTLILALAGASFGKTDKSSFPNIKIGNFGQMDEHFYRGARPKPEDFKNLAALGVKTVIDLTDNSMERKKPAVEAAGMRYVNIPIVDKNSKSTAQINE